MEKTYLKVTHENVAAIVRNSFKLTVAPWHETLFNLGVTDGQLHALKRAIRENFNMAVRVSVEDTVFTITSRML
jgi:hypothetical protein